MALSKTLTANGSKGHHKFTLMVNEDSTSGNNSYLSYSFTIAPIQSGWDWSGWGSQISYSISIGGNTYTGTIPSYNGSSTITLKNGSNIEIAHDSDGTKTINVSFSVSDTTGQNYTCGNASASDTFTLSPLHKAPRVHTIGKTEKNTSLTPLAIGQKIVQHLSNVDLKISVITYDSASLTECKVYHNGVLLGSSNSATYNPNTQEYEITVSADFRNFGPLNIYNYNGYNVIDLVIETKDSLNGTNSETGMREVIPYTKPSIEKTSSNIKRKTGGGTTLTDNIALLNFVGSIYTANDVVGNANSQQVQYKIWNDTEPSYSNVSSTLSGGTVTVSDYQLNNILYTKSYDYKIKINDAFIDSDTSDFVKSDKVPTGVSVWSEYKDHVDFLNISVGGDDVVAQETDGDWYVVKFYNGTAICALHYDYTVPNSWSAWGSMYSSGTIAIPDYPVVFTEIPTTVFSMQRINGSYNGWLIAHEGQNSSVTNCGNLQFIRPTNPNASFDIGIRVIAIGKWK